MKRFYEIMNVLQQTAAAPPAPAADINQTTARPEPAIDYPADGAELPHQDFNRQTMFPGVRTFQLPANLAQCWSEFTSKDPRKYLPNGQMNPNFDQPTKYTMLKMSKSAPLICVGGPDDGQPLTWNPGSRPRNRGGKKDDPKTVWVSELTYLLDIGLQGHLPGNQRVRPATIEAVMAEINKYAGKTVRLKTGLSGQCRPDAVKYIPIQGEGGTLVSIPDPNGAKGCGERYYTKAFKNPDAGQPEDPAVPNGAKIPDYELAIPCIGKVKGPDGQEYDCGAYIRGFESVDEVQAPIGS